MNNIKRILLKISGEMLSGTQEFGLQPEALELYAKKIKSVHDKGYEIDSNPNTKIDDSLFKILENAFEDSAVEKKVASNIKIGLEEKSNTALEFKKEIKEEKKEEPNKKEEPEKKPRNKRKNTLLKPLLIYYNLLYFTRFLFEYIVYRAIIAVGLLGKNSNNLLYATMAFS